MTNHRLPSYAALIVCLLPSAPAMARQPVGRPVMSAGDTAALSHALSDYETGNKATAILELKRLAVKYPDSFPANEALGLLYVDEGNFVQSLPYLEHAASAKKENAIAQANLGAAYLQAGDTKSAVRSLKRAAALDTKNVQTLSNLGHALFLDKQAQAAADVFAQALRVDPANNDIRYNDALALHVAGKDESASEVLQNIAGAERNEAVDSLWGDVAEKQGEFKEAVNHMQGAVQLNPSEQNIYALTVELLRHWTWKPATEIAEYGVRRFPESRRLQLAQATALFGNKDYAGAATALGALLSLDPDNEYYGELLGKSCSALGWSGSPQCDSLADFADRHPANAQAAVYAASNILHVSDPDTKDKLDHAQQMLERAIRVDPKIAKAYCELGTLQQERLQWKESVLNLNKAVNLRPAYPEAHYRLARAYAHLHEPELANKERALLLKDDQQVQDDSKTIISEVTTFLVESH